MNGVLSTIDYNATPGFQLVANSPQLNVATDLIYDVNFSSVSYNGADHYIAPFAFTAPTTTTTIDLSSPSLQVLPYQAPTDVPSVPAPQPGQPIKWNPNWRQRALYHSLSA
ncbi:hypothetical protein AWB91_08935 [Mycobacterium paraense]|uniref:Uncharacterized protein n=1 Tax=Mycobacterium paraense TaxID=767916 RepID=A0ABX3VTB1_9MYCO|nr:hypothetical protein AWB91_08935 [Mycobacterium paraense]ORW34699.1 hypothetical protein AWB88_02845 [Mycobacterium paraense]